MRIMIEYDSCWQMSFLDGDVTKFNRKFIATAKTKGQKSVIISKDTVMGVLNRLIGDQRKLFQARDSDNYYFFDMENHIDFRLDESKKESTEEIIYLTNTSDSRCGRNTFLGVLDDNNPWFFSQQAPLLWSVIFLNKVELLEFIVSVSPLMKGDVDSSPKNLMARIGLITDSKSESGAVWKSRDRLLDEKAGEIDRVKKKFIDYQSEANERNNASLKQQQKERKNLDSYQKSIDKKSEELKVIQEDSRLIDLDSRLSKAATLLADKFPDDEYIKDGSVYPYRIYAAALYLQAERLKKNGVNVDFTRNSKGGIQIQGFSKRGFNGVRDWLGKMTGTRKKAVGTPCTVGKQSGQLEIHLDIDNDEAIKLKNHIDCAGVSSFYLGKKGLAYVSGIDIR